MHFLKNTHLKRYSKKRGQTPLLISNEIFPQSLASTKEGSDPFLSAPTTAFLSIMLLSEVHASTASVISLSPGISSAQADSTSELLRFL